MEKVIFVCENFNGELIDEIILCQKKDDFFQVKELPFYSKNIAFDDMISVEIDGDSFYFEALIKASGHSVIQVTFLQQEKESEFIAQLRRKGYNFDDTTYKSFVSIDIPNKKSYNILKPILDRELQSGILDYRESCLGWK